MLLSIIDNFVTKNVSSDGITYEPTLMGSITIWIVIILLFLLGSFVLNKSHSKLLSTKELCFSAILVGVAFVISSVANIKMPYGGSITLFSMLFIALIGYFFGPGVGLTSSLAYGLLQLVINPTIVHPIQLLLDYPIAYTCLGFSGLFSKKKHGLFFGFLLGALSRYICHVISGVLFFSDYSNGIGALKYSLIYNASYMIPEVIATLIIIPILMPAFTKIKNMFIVENNSTDKSL